jgi:hypothetical protein
LQAWMGELRSKDIMTPDFLLLSEEEARDDNVVRPALLRGQVIVVTGLDQKVRGVIDVESQLDAVQRKLASSPPIHVNVEPDLRFHEVLRALAEAEARVALVTKVSASTGNQEVVGVITERQIAKAACATAKLTG